MNFDDRFLGILNMLGGLNGNGATPPNNHVKQNQGMGLENIMGIMGLMQGLQGGSKGSNTQQTNNSNGFDIMKILPIISALRGGGLPMVNPQNITPQNVVNENNSMPNIQSIDKTMQATETASKQGCFKDKYSAISFAGNEVIYSLGKLWKTYKE